MESPTKQRQKRRRSGSTTEASLSPQRQRTSNATTIPGNPFLSLSAVYDTSDDEALLHHAALFAPSSNEEKKPADKAFSVQRFEESALYLMRFLSSQKTLSEPAVIKSSPLTSTEIVQLLLPWCISQLQGLKAEALTQHQFLWKAIVVCISTSDENTVSKVLSQSLLFKLVPKVARLASSDKSGTIDAAEPSMRDDEDDGSPIAAAYNELLHLFRPTIDVACRTVLLPLLPKGKGDDYDRILPGNLDIELLRVTLLWIRQIHGSRKGNPKTTFQLFAEPDILMAFAHCYAVFSALEESMEINAAPYNKEEGRIVVRDLLWDVFFHSRHHMEGWIALWKKELSNSSDSATVPIADADQVEANASSSSPSQKSLSRFKTYHGELLDTVAKLCDVTVVSSVPKSILTILPVLFQGFVQQSNLWKKSEKEKQGSLNRNDSLPMVQFHVFFSWTRPLLHPIAILSSMSTLRKMLQIVYDSSIYAPTSDDPQYIFLEHCVSQILQASGPVVTNRENTVISESIECLHLLLQLNHVLLHDENMIASLNLCFYNSDDRLLTTSSQFVATIVDTYRKLRQQRQVVLFLLEVVRSQKSIDSKYDSSRFLVLLKQQPVVSALSNAMNCCPIVEMKFILEFCDEWLVKFSSHLLSFGLEVFVHLLSNIIRSIRVDSGSAPDIASLCKTWMSSSIAKLANENLGYPAFRYPTPSAELTTAMSLAGLFLDLHLRCLFWLSSIELLELPEAISTRVSQIRNRKFNFRAGCEDELESAILLSCHQLQLLHAFLRDDKRYSKEVNRSSKGEGLRLAGEASKIAAFIATQGRNPDKDQRNDGFIALAQNFSVWIAHVVEKFYIDQFLWWVVAASAQFVRPAMSRSFSNVVCSLDDVEFASSLLVDASFFQHSEVSSRISFMCLSLAADFISSSETGQFRPMHSIPFTMYDYKVDDEKTRMKRISSCGKPRCSLDSRSEFLFHMVHCAVLLANSLQMIASNEECSMLVFDRAIRLDLSCRSLCSAANFFTLAPIVSGLRVLMARLLVGASTTTFQTIFTEKSIACEFICGAISSVIDLLDYNESIDCKETKHLVVSSGQLVDVVLCKMNLDFSMGSTLAIAFSDLRSVAKSTQAVYALVSLSRYLVRGLNSNVVVAGPDDENVKKSFAKLFEEIKDLAVENSKHLSRGNRPAFPAIPVEHLTFTDGLLLLGDLACTEEAFTGTNGDTVDDMRLSCIDCLRLSKGQRLDASCWNVVCYVTGKVAQKVSCAELILSTLEALFCDLPLEYETYILEAAVCQMVQKLPQEKLLPVLEKIAHEYVTPLSAALRLRLTKHMLRYLASDEQISLLATFGQKFFTLALSPLRFDRSDPSWSESIIAACALLNDLLERRDVLCLKEREVALLLSHLVRALGPIDSTLSCTRTDPGLHEDHSAVFVSISEICGTLLQRYTKQVSNCAPSVISLMLALLRHATYFPSTSSEDENESILTRHLTRLCEVMIGQREVFKKYVIGLVLEFMSGIENSRINLSRKEALIPAVYCLLDAMSSYEMNQLNAHMNTKTRILFRSIHQNYLKLHSFKGQ